MFETSQSVDIYQMSSYKQPFTTFINDSTVMSTNLFCIWIKVDDDIVSKKTKYVIEVFTLFPEVLVSPRVAVGTYPSVIRGETQTKQSEVSWVGFLRPFKEQENTRCRWKMNITLFYVFLILPLFEILKKSCLPPE